MSDKMREALEKFRGNIFLSVSEVIDNDPCWAWSSVRLWAAKHGDGTWVDIVDVIQSSTMSTVEKMWVVFKFGRLRDDTKHSLAEEFALHGLPGDATAARSGLMVKRLYLLGKSSKRQLKEAASEVWEEAKGCPRSAAAAFACSPDPDVALYGAAARSGGWYGQDVDPTEKLWQWDKVIKAMEGQFYA